MRNLFLNICIIGRVTHDCSSILDSTAKDSPVSTIQIYVVVGLTVLQIIPSLCDGTYERSYFTSYMYTLCCM